MSDTRRHAESEPATDQPAMATSPRTRAPKTDTPIVPAGSIAGRALVAVIAIMTFLAALTLGAVVLIRAAATEWQSEVSREVTIQIRPVPNRDIEADVAKATAIAAATPGVAGVRPYSKAEAARLLEPWLGTGLSLDDLPIPRLIVVRITPDTALNVPGLAKALSDQVPGTSLDDHRGWINRMRTMARTAVAIGVGVLGLVVAAMTLSIMFATRSAIATNRPVIEVLHFVGAKHGFIAGQFQRHFLILGLKGGAIGGASAMLVFLIAGLFGNWFTATASGEQVAALFGSFAIGPEGYGAIVGLVILIAAVTAGTSRITVYRTLAAMD